MRPYMRPAAPVAVDPTNFTVPEPDMPTQTFDEKNIESTTNMINHNTDGKLSLSLQRDGWHLADKAKRDIGIGATQEEAIIAAIAGPSRLARSLRWELGQALSLSIDSDAVPKLYMESDDDDDDPDSEDNDSDEVSDPGVTVRRE